MTEILKKINFTRYDLLETALFAISFVLLLPMFIDWIFCVIYLPASIGFGYGSWLCHLKIENKPISKKNAKKVYIVIGIYYILLNVASFTAFFLWKRMHG